MAISNQVGQQFERLNGHPFGEYSQAAGSAWDPSYERVVIWSELHGNMQKVGSSDPGRNTGLTSTNTLLTRLLTSSMHPAPYFPGWNRKTTSPLRAIAESNDRLTNSRLIGEPILNNTRELLGSLQPTEATVISSEAQKWERSTTRAEARTAKRLDARGFQNGTLYSLLSCESMRRSGVAIPVETQEGIVGELLGDFLQKGDTVDISFATTDAAIVADMKVAWVNITLSAMGYTRTIGVCLN